MKMLCFGAIGHTRRYIQVSSLSSINVSLEIWVNHFSGSLRFNCMNRIKIGCYVRSLYIPTASLFREQSCAVWALKFYESIVSSSKSYANATIILSSTTLLMELSLIPTPSPHISVLDSFVSDLRIAKSEIRTVSLLPTNSVDRCSTRFTHPNDTWGDETVGIRLLSTWSIVGLKSMVSSNHLPAPWYVTQPTTHAKARKSVQVRRYTRYSNFSKLLCF